MITLEELKKEIEPYQNTLVIKDFEGVVRLVDVVDDEDDYYWVFDTKQGLCKSSCLIDFIPLKGFLSNENYNKLLRIWNLNNKIKAI